MSSRASPRSQGYPDDGGSRRSAHRRSVSAPNATVNTAAERGGGPESIHPSQHEFEIERPSTTLDGEFPVPPARELQQLTRSVTTHGAVACAASNSRGSSYTHSSYNYYPPHVHQHQPYFQQHQQYQHRGAPSLPPNPVRQPPAVGGVDPHHQQLHLHQHRVPSPSPHNMPQPHSHAHAHAHTPHIHQHSFGPLQQWQWQQRVYPHQHQHQPQQQLRGHITCSELERTTWAQQQQQQQHQHQQTWTLQDQQDMPWFGYDDDAAADLNEPYDEQRAPCMMDPHQYHQYEEATTPANCRTYPPHIQVTLGKEHITRAVPIMPMPMPVPAAGDVAEMEGTFASSPSASASASATSDPARAAEQRQQWVAWSENREGEASEGARQICAIATAQDLWKFLADYPILALGPNESLHLSLEGVRPLYTDKRNRHGGHVAVALPVGHATQQYWNHATYAMVTGALPFQEQITGMRAVRKADGLSVQLWITDSKAESAVRAIKNYLRHRASPTTIISFCPHKCIMQTLRQRPARGGPR